MKKQLLSVLAAVTALSGIAQISSPSWTINQNANYTPSVVATIIMDAVDANTVWAVGQNAIDGGNNRFCTKTTNGGTSWTANNLPDTNLYINANIEGIDGSTAWVSSFMKATQTQGAIHRTTNGGATWTNMTYTSAGMFTNTAAFTDIVSFFTPLVGIAIGDPVNNGYEIWRTTDGGLTWTPIPASSIPPPTSGEFAIVNLYCRLDANNLWYGTQKGRIYRTSDAGLTWQVGVVAANTFTVTDLAFSTPMNGIAIGVNTGNAWEAYITSNGGANWTQIPLDPNLGRNDICNIPGTTWFASVENQGTPGGIVSFSKDFGVTWTDWGSTGIQYFSIDFANNITGWAGGYSHFPVSNFGGIWKYSGTSFNSNFSIPQYLCKPIGNATMTPVNNSAGINNPLTYSWSASSGAVSFASNTSVLPVVTFTANGVYTVALTVTNPNGVNTSSQVVTVLTCSTPIAGFNSNATTCNNIAMSLTNTSIGVPNPSVTITANPPTNFTVTQGSGPLYTLKFGTPGIYTLTMLASSAAGTNAVTQTVNVNNCAPVVNFSIPNMYFSTNCFNKDSVDYHRMPTVNTSTAPISNLITYTWSSLPSAGVTFFPAKTNSVPTIAFTNSTSTKIYTITLMATNVSGTSSVTQTITVDALCTAINENSNLENNLEIFPNPAKDVLHINLPGNTESYQIKLTNIIGAVVYEEKSMSNKENLSINLGGKPKGVYFLTVFVNKAKVTKKIIIE